VRLGALSYRELLEFDRLVDLLGYDRTVNPLDFSVSPRGFRVLATSSHKGIPLEQANLTGQVAVLVGSEGAGIGRELLAKVDEVVAIPHSPKVESLNAGVAASIVLYEAARQRRS